MKLADDVEEEEEEQKPEKEESVRDRKKKRKVIAEGDEVEEPVVEPSASGDEEEIPQEDAKPIGDVIRTSGKGRGKRNHYESFEYDGLRYDLVFNFFQFLEFSEMCCFFVWLT